MNESEQSPGPGATPEKRRRGRRKLYTEPRVRLELRISPDLYNRLDEIAEARNHHLTAEAIAALIAWVEAYERERGQQAHHPPQDPSTPAS